MVKFLQLSYGNQTKKKSVMHSSISSASNALSGRLDEIKEFTDGIRGIFHSKTKVVSQVFVRGLIFVVSLFEMPAVRDSELQWKSASGFGAGACLKITSHLQPETSRGDSCLQISEGSRRET